MRLRLGAWNMTAGLACALAGCSGGGDVARQAGASGASIELPVPAPSPGKTVAQSDTVTADAGASPTTIGFPQGGGGLNGEAKAMLDRLAADPAVRGGSLTLRGHSDSEGDDEANRIMSRKRAEAVRDYLARKGLDRSRMRVIALGETRPVAPNAKPDGSDDSDGRARNRRVEIELDRGG
ncbi:OmpA family protein [Sphingomonas sp. Leaf257]|jgi:OOP family OmpA-OmpF porin|uniref:OmpA family protein n=1 Tax=Sphingomonas sp. Leaf257 TaxID=1736309 RepID=UPI0009E79681|nr:OmpA family protein [Sphingomonas sp. Leaf257]